MTRTTKEEREEWRRVLESHGYKAYTAIKRKFVIDILADFEELEREYKRVFGNLGNVETALRVCHAAQLKTTKKLEISELRLKKALERLKKKAEKEEEV